MTIRLGSNSLTNVKEVKCLTHLPWPPVAAWQSWICSDWNHSAGGALWSGDRGDSAGGFSWFVCCRPRKARTGFSPCPVASASSPSAAACYTSAASDSESREGSGPPGDGWQSVGHRWGRIISHFTTRDRNCIASGKTCSLLSSGCLTPLITIWTMLSVK